MYDGSALLDTGPLVLPWAGLVDADDPSMVAFADFFRVGPNRHVRPPSPAALIAPSSPMRSRPANRATAGTLSTPGEPATAGTSSKACTAPAADFQPDVRQLRAPQRDVRQRLRRPADDLVHPSVRYR